MICLNLFLLAVTFLFTETIRQVNKKTKVINRKFDRKWNYSNIKLYIIVR